MDETQIHQALREALVNTLIHADYSGRVSILVVKRPDLFGFRNPGMMRVPREEAVMGGISDCRNRNLQKMFQLVGLAEQAGSGIPKIYQSWRQQSWRNPEYEEKVEPEQTLLSMLTLSLLPEKTLSKLDERFGEKFRRLSEPQRLALVAVELEGTTTHARLRKISTDHGRDITLALQALVREGFLASDGGGKKSRYFFPGSQHLDLGSQHFALKTSENRSKSALPPEGSQHLNAGKELRTDLLEGIPEALKNAVISLRATGKAPKQDIREIILQLCTHRSYSLRDLAELLDRTPATLQNHHLGDLVKQGMILLRHPDKPNHPDQAYQALPSG